MFVLNWKYVSEILEIYFIMNKFVYKSSFLVYIIKKYNTLRVYYWDTSYITEEKSTIFSKPFDFIVEFLNNTFFLNNIYINEMHNYIFFFISYLMIYTLAVLFLNTQTPFYALAYLVCIFVIIIIYLIMNSLPFFGLLYLIIYSGAIIIIFVFVCQMVRFEKKYYSLDFKVYFSMLQFYSLYLLLLFFIIFLSFKFRIEFYILLDSQKNFTNIYMLEHPFFKVFKLDPNANESILYKSHRLFPKEFSKIILLNLFLPTFLGNYDYFELGKFLCLEYPTIFWSLLLILAISMIAPIILLTKVIPKSYDLITENNQKIRMQIINKNLK